MKRRQVDPKAWTLGALSARGISEIKPDVYWTVSYEAEGRTWWAYGTRWAYGTLLGWSSTDEWTRRDRLSHRAAVDAYRDFKSNPLNVRVRLVRVIRRESHSAAIREWADITAKLADAHTLYGIKRKRGRR